jgi:hypothetical protein
VGSVITSAPTRGLRRWFAVLGPIALWLAHIGALAALATASCTDGVALAAMHVITGITALGTLLAMWWSLAMVRRAGPIGEAEPTPQGRERFLGLFGLATGAVNLVLILWEGSYVLVIDGCRPL